MRYGGTIRQVRTHFLWMVLFALVVSTAPTLAATNTFAEVPDGHWSYRALIRLEELGLTQPRIASGYRLVTGLTRVEVAIEVAQALDHMMSVAADSTEAVLTRFAQIHPTTLVAAYNLRVSGEKRLTEADRNLFSDLISAYRPELEALGYRFDTGL